MNFRLLDKNRKPFHSGIAMRSDEPDVITWANRAFVRLDSVTEGDVRTIRYLEVSAHRIMGG